MESTGLTMEADRLMADVNSVASFCLKAVQEEPMKLECAARDLAFTLARIYISESIY